MGLRNVLRRAMKDRGMRLPAGLLKDDEPFIRSVAETLSPGDVVLDLGAHVGTAAIEFAHRAGEVHAFEPHPQIFAALQHNTRNYPAITAINKAVSDATGTMDLYFEAAQKGQFYEGSSLVTEKTNLSYTHSVAVETVALAEYVAGLGKRVRLIKMDVEGAEYRVISALIETPAMGMIDKVYVEDHCDRVAGLAEERARTEARIAALGLTDRFDFTWP